MYVSLIVTFLLVLGITVFALQNDAIITIKFFVWEFNYTQVAVILGSALAGAAIMAVLTWPPLMRKHLKARRLARQIRDLEKKHQHLENLLLAQGAISSSQVNSQKKQAEAGTVSSRSEETTQNLR